MRLREDSTLAIGILPCGRAAVERAIEKRRCELRGIDDRRVGTESDATERSLHQVEREPRYPAWFVKGGQAVDTRRS